MGQPLHEGSEERHQAHYARVTGIEMVATLWRPSVRRPPTPSQADWSRRTWHAYQASLRLFSMSGVWPISRISRHPRSPGYSGVPNEPCPPPAGISEEQEARVRLLLEKQGWTILRVNGELKLVRTI
jgi:hypothetical protein